MSAIASRTRHLRPPWPPLVSAMPDGWERRLGLAVIHSAWLDLRAAHEPHRQSARRFFEGEACELWSAIAGVDPRRVRRAAKARGTR